VVEEHRHERLAPARVLDEREQRHRVDANTIVAAFESFDERVNRVRADDGKARASAIDLFGSAAAESPDELGDFGCPGPKRHLK
jgi:hypothetical protein